MNDTERLNSLKAALELAQLAEVNVELTTDNLQWLIYQADIVQNMNIARTQQLAILLKIYGLKFYYRVWAGANTPPPPEGRCLFRSLMETGADDADLTEEGEE
jgi:hypothetical protein